MNNIYFQLTIVTNLIFIINAIECDFDKFTNGCDDSFGSECNKTSNECQCKTGFTIKIDEYCLPPKNFSESCSISAQCRQTPISNIGCYIDEKEIDIKTLKSWINSENLSKIIGVCSCPPTHYLSPNKECVRKKLFDENCLSSQECIVLHSYCDQITKKCKCKPTFRYSIRKNRCVSQLAGESCSVTEHCFIHDPNAECRVGSCQCRSGFVLSNSGKCVFVRIKSTSNHLLMMLIVIGTAVVFALLSTAHRKWSASEDIFDRNANQALTNNLMMRRTFQSPNSFSLNNSQSTNCHQSFPMPLSVPSLALIWPLRTQNQSQFNQYYSEDGPPSYAEAINQSVIPVQNVIQSDTTINTPISQDIICNNEIHINSSDNNNSTLNSNTNV